MLGVIHLELLMRLLLISFFLFSAASAACTTKLNEGFLPYAVKEKENRYKIVFPVSDFAKEPMFIDSLVISIEKVVTSEISYLTENGYAIAYIDLEAAMVDSTRFIGSYNNGNKEGTIWASCANWKSVSLKVLLKNAENV